MVIVRLAAIAGDFAGDFAEASVKSQENKRGRGEACSALLSGYLLCEMCFYSCNE